MTHAAQSTKGVLDLVVNTLVSPITGFLNSLYRAATTDFDTQKFASKSTMELADIGLRRDDLALVVRPSHLNA